MTPRAKKWWFIGGGAWVVFGGAPAAVLLLDALGLDSDAAVYVLLCGTATAGVLSAILIRPRPRPWVSGALTMIWTAGWWLWISLLLSASGYAVDRLVKSGALQSGGGFLGNFLHELAIALIASCLITTALLTMLTRSWRIGILTLIPAAVFAIAWALGSDVMWDDALWHPIVIGALMLWAVPKRIRPFPAHACQSCGYDLRGLDTSAKCPECGYSEHNPQSTDHKSEKSENS